MADPQTRALAADIAASLAPTGLTPRQAKLYSQRLRLDMGREGLATFRVSDVESYMDEAALLLTASLLDKGELSNDNWRRGVKRAAEIYEWLSQSGLRPAGAPVHLLAAAAFQLSGFPAMALGHLRQVPSDEPQSVLLREFLRGDFPAAQKALGEFWARYHTPLSSAISKEDGLTAETFRHFVMCLGTVCAYFRTGDATQLHRAIVKLRKLSSSLIHSRDQYSSALAQLIAEVADSYASSSVWPYLNDLREISDVSVSKALLQYGRLAYENRRSLVWAGQSAGIKRLATGTSFVLCTPTGSGKTTVATLAIIQSLMAEPEDDGFGFAALQPGSLVLYVVPSRALAAEVEGRLAQDLRGLAAQAIVVTGLYGGNDWGPTDAWIQRDRATIVICTFEKADALIRYLGVLFLNRVRLVVIDEAHMVEQNPTKLDGLRDGTSRSLRLEQLSSRLLRSQDEFRFRIIALSAVAGGAGPAIARWIGQSATAQPVTSSQRSTRQMFGRIPSSHLGRSINF